MSYPINTTIPNEPNDPVDDCPLIRGNFSNIKNYLDQDHVSPGAPGNGYHKEVTFYNKVPQGVPIDPTSVMFTESGTASTVADARFKNANGTFPVNPLRVICNFVTANNGIDPQNITPVNQYNVDSISRSGPNYTITFTPGSLNTSIKPIAFATNNVGSSSVTLLPVAFSGTTMTISTGSIGTYVNLIVYQV